MKKLNLFLVLFIIVFMSFSTMVCKDKGRPTIPSQPMTALSNVFKITNFQYGTSYGASTEYWLSSGVVKADYTNTTNIDVVISGIIKWGDGASESFTGMNIPKRPENGQWDSWIYSHGYSKTGTYTVEITATANFSNGVVKSIFKKDVVITIN